MKRIWLVFGLMLVSVLAVLGSAAQVLDQSTQAQRPKPSSTYNQPMQRMDLKYFTGKIVKTAEGKLVLLNSPTMITYQLDNQKLAKKFVGKEVTVEGQLIPPGNAIHVRNIVRVP